MIKKNKNDTLKSSGYFMNHKVQFPWNPRSDETVLLSFFFFSPIRTVHLDIINVLFIHQLVH